MKTEKEYRYWLCNIPGMGARKISELLRIFGSAEEIWKSSRAAMEKAIEEVHDAGEGRQLFRKNDADVLLEAKDRLEEITGNYHALAGKGIRFITPQDVDYPQRLRSLYDAPQGLYVLRKLPEQEVPAVAIVGARNCSHYGEEMAFVLASELCKKGIDVISGMALGIDGQAHSGVLAQHRSQMQTAGQSGSGVQNGYNCHLGGTYAVLGCGVDVCYPRTHTELYHNMQGIISEFPPGTEPYASHFPMRNRIISGLADMVIVVEARFRSGSLITADQALEQGRDVYAVPGRITDSLSKGCNELIKQGAGIITDPVEFVENLFPEPVETTPNGKKHHKTLTPAEEKVYGCLDFEPVHLGMIVNRTGFSPQEIVSILMQLMMKGLIAETSKNFYALKFR